MTTSASHGVVGLSRSVSFSGSTVRSHGSVRRLMTIWGSRLPYAPSVFAGGKVDRTWSGGSWNRGERDPHVGLQRLDGQGACAERTLGPDRAEVLVAREPVVTGRQHRSEVGVELEVAVLDGHRCLLGASVQVSWAPSPSVASRRLTTASSPVPGTTFGVCRVPTFRVDCGEHSGHLPGPARLDDDADTALGDLLAVGDDLVDEHGGGSENDGDGRSMRAVGGERRCRADELDVGRGRVDEGAWPVRATAMTVTGRRSG